MTKPKSSTMALSKQLELIFETSSDGIWVCDGEGIIVALNKASERLNGVSAREVVGKSVSVMIDKNIVDVNITPEVIRTRQSISRMQYIKRTGRHLMVTGSPAFDDHGKLIMIVVNERDVTELDVLKKKLEKAKWEKEQAMSRLTSLEATQHNDMAALADNPVMIQVFETGLKLAQHEVTNILVTGETGSGKGVLCKFIQKNSPRRKQPFITINCAALPKSLLEAELFGYERGAFTGARENGKPGLFELADKGILFLDEIGDMPMSIQSKLLKYLDDYEVMRLGGTRSRKIDCLILAATNQNLEKRVEGRLFRRDLLHRINRFVLNIPPLRERQEDIFILSNHFLDEQNRRFGIRKRIGSSGMALLKKYPFPGNVRELRNIIEQAAVIAKDEYIDSFLKEKISIDSHQVENADALLPHEPKESFQTALDRYEKKLIAVAAVGCRSSIELASNLGVSQATAFRKMKKFGIQLGKKTRMTR